MFHFLLLILVLCFYSSTWHDIWPARWIKKSNWENQFWNVSTHMRGERNDSKCQDACSVSMSERMEEKLPRTSGTILCEGMSDNTDQAIFILFGSRWLYFIEMGLRSSPPSSLVPSLRGGFLQSTLHGVENCWFFAHSSAFFRVSSLF